MLIFREAVFELGLAKDAQDSKLPPLNGPGVSLVFFFLLFPSCQYQDTHPANVCAVLCLQIKKVVAGSCRNIFFSNKVKLFTS